MAGPTDHLNQLTDRRLAGQRLRGGAGLWPGAGISALRDWLPGPEQPRCPVCPARCPFPRLLPASAHAPTATEIDGALGLNGRISAWSGETMP